jgi:hypothetical protein
MARAKSVTFHRRAAMALDAFSPQERARIADAARLLQGNGDEALLQTKTAKLATSEPMYVMRATPAIRLIYRETADGIEVLDVVRRETLQTFAKMAAQRDTPAPVAGPVNAAPAKTGTAAAGPPSTRPSAGSKPRT